MPIRGLTDEIRPRFPRLGKLRKGGEKTASGVGPELDHWRFVGATPEIQAAFEQAYGKEPRSISIYIPHATPEGAFPTWCEIWGATGLVHRCDGQTMTVWLEGDKYVTGSRPCAGGHKDNDPLNDAVGRLDVIIPELIEAGFVGYVTMETHSKNDIIGILQTLHAVYDARRGNELGLRGVLFYLRRVQESISTPGFGKNAGKRSRVTKWLVRLEPAADWVQLQIEMAHAAQMQLDPGTQPVAQLPGGNGDEEITVTGEIVDIESPPAVEEDRCPSCGQLDGFHASNCPEFHKQMAPPPEPTLLQAVKYTVKSGKTGDLLELGELTDDQLAKVVELTKDPKAKKAAQYLLERAHKEDQKLWSELFNRAKKEGISEDQLPALPGDATAIELYRQYHALEIALEVIYEQAF